MGQASRISTRSPRITCPVCDTQAQTVRRGQIEYDRCPTCNGVWLDCGELEMLLALAHRAGRTGVGPSARQ